MTPQDRRPRWSTVLWAIGRVTFLEILRDKILYNILLCFILLLGVGFLASRLTFIRPDRVILDFGISAINLICAMIAIFMGSGLLAKELDRRTAYAALCRPISRTQFVLGKFIGLGAIIAMNWGLLSLLFLGVLDFSANEVQSLVSATLLIALFFILLQTLLIASLTIFFSTFSTTSLSAMMAIGLYLIGNNISQLRLIAAKLHSQLSSSVVNALATVLPNLEYFNLGTKVTYGLPLTWQFVALSVLYGIVMISIFLGLAGVLIQGLEV